jgi:outer membrane immunogenic protein
MPEVNWQFLGNEGLGMRRLAIVRLGLLSIAGFVGAAAAADLPARTYTKAPTAVPVMTYNWGGFYIGLNGGGGSSHNCWNLTAVAAGPIPATPSEGCSDGTGALVGGQVGYRWQATNWVFGLEAQGDWANLRGSNVALGTFGGQPFLNQTKTDAIGLFTGQVGYAWNNLLAYMKGGAAVTHDRYNGVTQFAVGPFPVGFAFDGARETRWGGAVGVGVEYGFAPNWSVAIEYDHLFMGRSSNNIITPAGVFDRTENVRQDIDMGTVRLNYTFGGPAVARY